MSDEAAPSPQDALAERREQIAGLLAEKALALACEVQQRALTADDTDECVKLVGAFTKLGRAVRQTLALQAKLAHDRTRVSRETLKAATAEKSSAVMTKRQRLRDEVSRACWDEYEDDAEIEEAEVEELEAEIERVLDQASDAPDFLEIPLETLVARLCERLGVTAPAERVEPPAFPRIRARYAERDTDDDSS